MANTLPIEVTATVATAHTVGADVGHHHLGSMSMSPCLDLWCSCGWRGDPVVIRWSNLSLDDIPAEAFDEAARAWRYHVRLSNRISEAALRLGRADGEAE